LEYVDLSNIKSNEERKDILLEREQYYLDKINPSLNVCKTAGRPLGVKREIGFGEKMSKIKRGIKLNTSKFIINKRSKFIANDTKDKLSLRCQGISVKVFDKSKNLVKQFPSMRSAALHFNIDSSTIARIFKTSKSYDDFTYKFEFKDNRIRVYDKDHVLIHILANIKKTSLYYNIPYTTVSRYVKSGKLYKNKFYFYSVNSVSNTSL
jgi:NUMOD1 domain